MSFVRHAILSLLCLIDEAIYSIASMIYSLLMYIAESNIFTQETLQSFATRIYVLIGVFMLFKVSFSLINYIVNPDDFTNGEKGVNKLVSNVMITLVLIVFTPRIFAEAMELQKLITSQHFFEKIILSTGYNEAIENDPGDNMAISLFSAFFYYDKEAPTSDDYYTQLDGTTYFAYNSMYAAFNSESEYNAYDGIWDDAATYKPIISTAAGVVLILVLIQFCFDIAIRAVKLGFLELMAPIPIISRMDPKSAKNGMFSKWLKECTSTYLDLFVRLVALFFAIYVINLILETPFAVDPDTNGITQMLVRAMLMLGALLFARQLPKFISNLFGVNLGGGFTLNPMKRLREVPGSHLASAAIAGVGGAVAGGAANYYAARKMDASRGERFLSTAGGAFSSLFRSTYSGLTDNKNKPFKAIGKGVKGSVTARNERDEREEAGEPMGIAGLKEKAKNRINQFAGVVGSDEESIKHKKKMELGKELYKNYGEYEVDEKGDIIRNADGTFKKSKNNKYSLMKSEAVQNAWRDVDNFKPQKYAYENASELEIEQSIKEKGFYELTFKDENGKLQTVQYKSLAEFNSDKQSKLASYKKLTTKLDEQLSLPENSGDKRRYEAYTSAADSTEAIVKLSTFQGSTPSAETSTSSTGGSGGSGGTAAPVYDKSDYEIVGRALHNRYNETTKFEMIKDDKLREAWKQNENAKVSVEAFANVNENTVAEQIKNSGSFKLEYKDSQGNNVAKQYASVAEFTADKSKCTAAYEKLNEQFQATLNADSNAEDKMRFDAYNSYNYNTVDVGAPTSGAYYENEKTIEKIAERNNNEFLRNSDSLNNTKTTVTNNEFINNINNENHNATSTVNETRDYKNIANNSTASKSNEEILKELNSFGNISSSGDTIINNNNYGDNINDGRVFNNNNNTTDGRVFNNNNTNDNRVFNNNNNTMNQTGGAPTGQVNNGAPTSQAGSPTGQVPSGAPSGGRSSQLDDIKDIMEDMKTKLTDSLEDVNENLSNVNNNLRENNDSTKKSLNDLNDSLNKIKDNSKKTGQILEDANKKIDKVNKNIKNINETVGSDEQGSNDESSDNK